MKPLIKWPGGKSRELKYILPHVPQFKRYFEPFFGGGAVGFNLEPKKALVNDLDQNLIKFYKAVKEKDPIFLAELSNIDHDWKLIERMQPILFRVYRTYMNGSRDPKEIKHIEQSMSGREYEQINDIANSLKFADGSQFMLYLDKSVRSKLTRVTRLKQRHKVTDQALVLSEQMMTAIKAAYYFMLRDEYFNKSLSSSVFYFIREFCYGSMFRYSSRGNFNIPYGGMDYNSKDFTSKIESLTSEKLHSVIANFEFFNLDFETFLSMFDLSSQDFIFLDPPYDSDFNNYNNKIFSESDQARLADFLVKTPAKWLLVIQGSDYIRELYENLASKHKNIQVLEYSKKYTYNVRGRNERNTQHLLVKNYTDKYSSLSKFF